MSHGPRLNRNPKRALPPKSSSRPMLSRAAGEHHDLKSARDADPCEKISANSGECPKGWLTLCHVQEHLRNHLVDFSAAVCVLKWQPQKPQRHLLDWTSRKRQSHQRTAVWTAGGGGGGEPVKSSSWRQGPTILPREVPDQRLGCIEYQLTNARYSDRVRDKARDKVPDKVRDKLLDKQLSGKLSGGLSGRLPGGLSAHFAEIYAANPPFRENTSLRVVSEWF